VAVLAFSRVEFLYLMVAAVFHSLLRTCLTNFWLIKGVLLPYDTASFNCNLQECTNVTANVTRKKDVW